MTHAILWSVLVLSGASCRHARPVAVHPAAPPAPAAWSGVTSSVARAADTLAQAALPSREDRNRGRRNVLAALEMTRLADSLLGTRAFFGAETIHEPASVGQEQAAIAAFNEGARALTAYAQEADSVRAALLLEQAALHFAAALEANPHDEDAHYWLVRVYELQADALGKAGAVQDAIALLERLVSMQQHRHDYIAHLAELYERLATSEAALAAGALWQRAAQVVIDDAALDPEGHIVVDSATVFAHLARSGRAYVQAMRSDLVLEALDTAAAWANAPEDMEYLAAERRWILWDDGNLATRMHFDQLLALAPSNPKEAAFGMVSLLTQVQAPHAHLEVQHEHALLQYHLGQWEEAVQSLQSLWVASQSWVSGDSSRHRRIREDYGTMTFNVGMARRAAGDLRAALAYLMQSEATGFSQWARAALQVSRLLSRDFPAALAAGLRAEAGLAGLPRSEQKALLRHLVELYRRSGNRERAEEYLVKYRRLP